MKGNELSKDFLLINFTWNDPHVKVLRTLSQLYIILKLERTLPEFFIKTKRVKQKQTLPWFFT